MLNLGMHAYNCVSIKIRKITRLYTKLKLEFGINDFTRGTRATRRARQLELDERAYI